MNKEFLNIEEDILRRHEDFISPLYYCELEEIDALKRYLDYVILNTIISPKLESNFIFSSLVTFQKDLIKEAYTSLMLGNYVAFSGAMRTMIENYVYFTLIKKYHKEEVWKDYFIWCLNIIYKKYPILAKNQALTDIANKMYEAYNLKPNSNTKPNGWLERVTNKKKITFKDACELIDNKVYEDYKSLSEYVHSTNYIFKN